MSAVLLGLGVLMLVVPVVMGAGGRSGQQGHRGNGGEQQVPHRMRGAGSALKVWAQVGRLSDVLRVVTDLPITAALQPARLTP